MHRTIHGFTVIELMIVVVVLGILVAIAYPNYVTMQDRAREGATKANMHAFQLTAEDYGIRNRGAYAATAADVAALLPGAGNQFQNPFDHSIGDLNAWKDGAGYSPTMATGSAVRGIVAYADSAQHKYVIAGRGSSGDIALHLLGGD